MSNIRPISWQEVRDQATRIADRWRGIAQGVHGVPTGGAPLAVMVSDLLDVPLVDDPKPGNGILVVDDLIDSGRTMTRYNGFFRDAAFRKPWSPDGMAPDALEVTEWIAFPWEKDEGDPTDAVVRLLQHLGEDPSRDGLIDTPRRVVKALRELTSGYDKDPAQILSTTFEVEHDEMIVLRNIPFSSLCEHHMLPFHGHATVAYIPKPGGRVVGLSKLARLVDAYARRLQVQERMTDEIAKALETHLDALGVGVIITAHHTCMSMRGIGTPGEMVTSAMRGVMRTDHDARAELLALTKD